MQLQLTPSSDKLLPLSYLKDLSDEQRNEPESWFDTQGAPLDYFVVHFKEEEFVEELVVKVGKNKYPFSLNREIKTIQNAITKPWTISLKGEVFQFSVKFYRYAWYIPNPQQASIDHVLKHLNGDTFLYGDAPKDRYVPEVLSMPNGKPVVLKKTNFCNRVRLIRSEWIAGFGEIRLNTSKEVFDSETFLGDSEFDIFLDEMGVPTVEICVEDFNPDYQEQQTGRTIDAMLSGSGMLMVTWWILLFKEI